MPSQKNHAFAQWAGLFVAAIMAGFTLVTYAQGNFVTHREHDAALVALSVERDMVVERLNRIERKLDQVIQGN